MGPRIMLGLLQGQCTLVSLHQRSAAQDQIQCIVIATSGVFAPAKWCLRYQMQFSEAKLPYWLHGMAGVNTWHKCSSTPSDMHCQWASAALHSLSSLGCDHY